MQIWGGSNIRREYKSCVFMVIVLFLLILLADSLLMKTNPLIPIASAPTREFEEDITIPSNEFYILELGFSEGDELELIFTLEVEQSLPIDVWFVNYANYVRLVDGNEFLYFIDGSGQEITQAQKVVSVTQHGPYNLVLANYNNVTVDVHLTYDINVYPEEETVPLWKEPYVMLPLGLIIGIVVGVLAFRISHRSGKGAPKTTAKAPKKKAKTRKVKKAKPIAAMEKPKKKVNVPKAKKKVVEDTEEAPKEKGEELGAEEKEPKVAKATPAEKISSPNFCGHCGKPVETPFCPFCGKEVKTG
jgi:hypothetical protein